MPPNSLVPIISLFQGHESQEGGACSIGTALSVPHGLTFHLLLLPSGTILMKVALHFKRSLFILLYFKLFFFTAISV